MNVVFTKRGTEQPMVLWYDNVAFYCLKEGSDILLYVADEHTGAVLSLKTGALCGRVDSIKSKQIEFSFSAARAGGTPRGCEVKCSFTYQTSCLPFLAGAIFPKTKRGLL